MLLGNNSMCFANFAFFIIIIGKSRYFSLDNPVKKKSKTTFVLDSIFLITTWSLLSLHQVCLKAGSWKALFSTDSNSQNNSLQCLSFIFPFFTICLYLHRPHLYPYPDLHPKPSLHAPLCNCLGG